METKAVVTALAALAQDSRLAIFRALIQAGLAVVPPEGTVACRDGEFAAVGALCHLHRELRDHERAAGFSHRKLLRRKSLLAGLHPGVRH